jgi:hypothetical protein
VSGGLLSVIGLTGGTAEAFTDIAVPRGLIRVRVHARIACTRPYAPNGGKELALTRTR